MFSRQSICKPYNIVATAQVLQLNSQLPESERGKLYTSTKVRHKTTCILHWGPQTEERHTSMQFKICFHWHPGENETIEDFCGTHCSPFEKMFQLTNSNRKMPSTFLIARFVLVISWAINHYKCSQWCSVVTELLNSLSIWSSFVLRRINLNKNKINIYWA